MYKQQVSFYSGGFLLFFHFISYNKFGDSMESFKLKEEELIKKIINPNFTKLVIIGKNGVGKTTFLQNIIKKIEEEGFKTYFIKADVSIDKELKNQKDNNLQKLGLLLNDLTNFVYRIEIEKIMSYFKSDEDFNKFVEESNLSIDSVEKWIKINISNNKLIINENDSDLKNIDIAIPNRVSSNIFELNFYQKLPMGSMFKSISEKAGTGQYFYTILVLVNKILEFCSLNKEKPYYLIIDEPENLCHPELIIKIAKSIKKINNNIIKIICVSHSNIFVNNLIDKLDELILMEDFDKKNLSNNFLQYNEKIFLNNANVIFNNMSEIASDFKKDKNKYLKDKSIILEKLIDIYSKGFNNWFKTWPLRHDFINALFYKNIILCEGLNDEYFLNYLSLETNIFILKSFGKFEIPFLKLVLFLFNKKIYVVYDNDISRKNDNETQKRNNFWIAINSIVENNYSICKENSYSFDFNLEYAIKIDLNNNLKIICQEWICLLIIKIKKIYKKFKKN